MPLSTATEQPFGEAARQVKKIVDQLQRGYFNFSTNETWTPNVNLYETHSAYLVCVDLAGVEKEKIDITVDQNVLKLHGHRVVPSATGLNDRPRVRVHLMEIDHGGFSRAVELPRDVKHDQIAAHYDDGLLWITLPKQ